MMRRSGFLLVFAVATAFAASCAPAPAAMGPPGAAFCARSRALGCDGASTCMSFIDPTVSNVPAACISQWNAFLSCLDANAPTITCATLNPGGAMPLVCASEFNAAAQCGMGARETGAVDDAASD